MNQRITKRRDFLKSIGNLFLGIILFPFEGLFRKDHIGNGKSTSMKEAMYYIVDDNLAG